MFVRGRQRQLGLPFRARGGARAGAGRPPNGPRAGVPHARRQRLSRHHAVHVTLKVRRGVQSLRAPALFVAVQRALAAGKERFGFRLVHFSMQNDHLHLLAEADDPRALARGVQGLSVRVARAVNRHVERKGRLFADRYHARVLKTPRTVRLALRYVLLNSRKHERAVPAGFVDACSPAPWFDGFARPAALAFSARAAREKWADQNQADSAASAAPVVAPHSWLLRAGWQRAGLFDVDDTPSAGPPHTKPR